MPMATRPCRVVIDNEELLSIRSHDPLITSSSGFDFSYITCRFRTQTAKLPPTSFCSFHAQHPKCKFWVVRSLFGFDPKDFRNVLETFNFPKILSV